MNPVPPNGIESGAVLGPEESACASHERPGAKPLILDIKGNSLDDGPGIRTVVFFKGCPLSCLWCHNPESKTSAVEISFDPTACVGCDTCLRTCREGALSRDSTFFIDRGRCSLCFDCIESCPSGALGKVGRSMTVDAILTDIVKDKPFFDNSGGGATLSGGEPTLFMGYLSELLQKLHAKQIHTLIETCGYFDFHRFEDLVLPYVESVYYDIKLIDEREHARCCGIGNRTILHNFALLVSSARISGKEVLPRTPLVPGITDTEANLQAIADFLRRHGVEKASLQPYNPLWPEKTRKIGVSSKFGSTATAADWMPREHISRCKDIFVRAGIEV